MTPGYLYFFVFSRNLRKRGVQSNGMLNKRPRQKEAAAAAAEIRAVAFVDEKSDLDLEECDFALALLSFGAFEPLLSSRRHPWRSK